MPSRTPSISEKEPSDTPIGSSIIGKEGLKTSLYLPWTVINYTPPYLRHDPNKPQRFSWSLILLFSFASTFTVANLYYSHPILNLLARDFHVTNERASLVPTLAQAGYAAGLLLLCPLGDLVERRPFVVGLVGLTGVIWVGLCVTKSFEVFCFLTFVTGFTTVTPQLLLPLVGDLAPPNRRATALSIVVSGLLLGILIARVLSGVVTEYTSWRNIYWLAFGLQVSIFGLLFCFLPPYPAKNPPAETNMLVTYGKLLWSILTLLTKHPLLVQSCALGLCASTTFTSFWTTLTFLLSSSPYNYSPLIIGLFALIGIAALFIGPVYSRIIIDRFIPHFSVFLGLVIILVGTFIGMFVAPISVSGVVIQAFLLDLGLQSSQIANRAAVYGIEPKARNRLNTAFMLSVFIGQIIGTAVGNAVYARAGWKGSNAVSVGFLGLGLVIWAMRGPKETGWVGYSGGWTIQKPPEDANQTATDMEAAQSDVEKRNNSDDGSASSLCEQSQAPSNTSPTRHE